MSTTIPVLRAQIVDAIEGVLDPCSRFNGTRLSLLDLGMIDAIEVNDRGRVLIRLLLDDPLCPYLSDIRSELTQAVLAVPGVAALDLYLRGDKLWTEDRLSDAARKKLCDLRERRQHQTQPARA